MTHLGQVLKSSATRHIIAALLLLLGAFASSATLAQQAIDTRGSAVHTVFWTQKNLALVALCQNGFCLASTSLFCSVVPTGGDFCTGPDPSQTGVRCPGPAGTQCVYHIGVEASVFLGNLLVG